MSLLKAHIKEAQKQAMRSKEKQRLLCVRTIAAEIKRIEVDERIEVGDDRILVILDKMLKQRRDSIQQFEAAGRDDLVAQEQLEMDIIQEFLPAPLTNDEISQLIDQAISATDAKGMQDMGKLMGVLKPQLQGRADMGKVSGQIKARLQA